MSKLINFVEKIAKLKKDGGICTNKNKLIELQDKLNYLKNKVWKDDALVLAQNEARLLGVSISSSKIDIYNDSRITHTCKDVLMLAQNSSATIGVDILEVREFVTQSGKSQGKKRADLIVSDSTAKIKCKVWSEAWEVYNNLLIKGNSVILIGSKGWGRYNDNFIVDSVIQP